MPVKKAAKSKTKASKKTTSKRPVKKTSAKKPKKAAKKSTRKTSAKKKTPVKKKTTAAKKAAGKKPAAKRKSPAKKKAVKSSKQRKATRGDVTVDPMNGFKPYKMRRGEPYMSEGQMKHFRDILINWKRDLMEEVDRTVHHMKDEAANFPDPTDRATQESEFSLELRTRDRERKLIRKIDKSLRRLEEHDFGYCDSCGTEIGVRRLEARPTADMCVDCKSLDEIRERQQLGK